jgi:hypothetical protein
MRADKTAVVIATLGLLGCKSTWWTEARATELEIGSFVVKIPDGWRAASELRNVEKTVAKYRQRGVTALLRADADFSQLQPVVTLQWEPSGSLRELPCEAIATEGSTVVAHDVKTTTLLDGDLTCDWRTVVTGEPARMITRFSGDHMLIIGCRQAGNVAPELDATCATLAATLKRKAP